MRWTSDNFLGFYPPSKTKITSPNLVLLYLNDKNSLKSILYSMHIVQKRESFCFHAPLIFFLFFVGRKTPASILLLTTIFGASKDVVIPWTTLFPSRCCHHQKILLLRRCNLHSLKIGASRASYCGKTG